MRKIVSDVSTISTIPEKMLDKLIDKSFYCISDALLEDIENDKDVTELDIGIGILYIKHSADQVAYKFIPSDELQETVNSTVKTRQNSLTKNLEASLIKKFLDVYKDIC